MNKIQPTITLNFETQSGLELFDKDYSISKYLIEYLFINDFNDYHAAVITQALANYFSTEISGEWYQAFEDSADYLCDALCFAERGYDLDLVWDKDEGGEDDE